MEAEEVVEGEANQVVAVTRKGYLLHDQLLRSAKVKVGSGRESEKLKKEKLKNATNN
jgi:molecular chaperone GrpE (heat shock protein)